MASLINPSHDLHGSLVGAFSWFMEIGNVGAILCVFKQMHSFSTVFTPLTELNTLLHEVHPLIICT
jgi:hypothetical protein